MQVATGDFCTRTNRLAPELNALPSIEYSPSRFGQEAVRPPKSEAFRRVETGFTEFGFTSDGFGVPRQVVHEIWEEIFPIFVYLKMLWAKSRGEAHRTSHNSNVFNN
jgi:hypothetical protein